MGNLVGGWRVFWLPYSFFQTSGAVREAYVLEDAENTTPPAPVDPTQPRPTSAMPNLQVQSWHAQYDPRPGGTGTLEYSVVNAGTGIAQAGADVNLILSLNSTISSSDIYVVWETIPFDLEPGTQIFRDTSNQLHFSFPENLQPGTYYMAVWVDDLNVVAESNENDNVSLGSAQVAIENTLPDLVVRNWYAQWDGLGNGLLQYGVVNQGNSTATSTTWDISLGLDNRGDTVPCTMGRKYRPLKPS